MSNPVTEILLSQKTATVTASGSIGAWFGASVGWVDANMLDISAFASFILVVVMIIVHVCSTIRQNREHRVVMRKSELELELLRAQVEKITNPDNGA